MAHPVFQLQTVASMYDINITYYLFSDNKFQSLLEL